MGFHQAVLLTMFCYPICHHSSHLNAAQYFQVIACFTLRDTETSVIRLETLSLDCQVPHAWPEAQVVQRLLSRR